MTKTRITAILLTVLILGTGSALAQQTFRDFVRQEGFNWVIGHWTAQTEEGDTLDLTYRWVLKGQMIVTNFKMGDEAYQGIIYLIPDEEKVVEVGVHGNGDRSKAAWEPKGEKLMTTREKVGSYGDSQKMAVVFSKGSRPRTMNVAIHAYEYGSMAAEPTTTLVFKRQPARNKAKTTGQ